MQCGDSIINLISITTLKGEPELIDYVTSKGAIVGFMRALATNLAFKGIRVNAVALEFFWTPLQLACWEAEKISTLGADSPMERGGETFEIVSFFAYLASSILVIRQGKYFISMVVNIRNNPCKSNIVVI